MTASSLRSISNPSPASDSDRVRIAIVGAGPVGLTLALGLARRGVRCLLVERKRALSEYSRAIALFPRSLEVLDAVGVLPELMRRAEVNRHIRIRRTEDHHTLLDFDFNSLDQVTTANFALAIPQNHTEAVLLDALRRYPACEVRLGTELVALEDDDAGATLQLRDTQNEDAALASVRVDWVVGTDGARSAVREHLGLELVGQTYDSRAYLADVRLTADADNVDGWVLATGLESFVNGIRYADRTWRIIDQGVPERITEANLHAHARELAEALFGRGSVEEVLWASVYRKHERQADTFRRGRIVIAGDAAHLNSPAGGQGMNTGLRDAHNLAWKLDLALTGTADVGPLLDSYSAEQRSAFETDVVPLTDLVERGQTAPLRIRQFVFRNLWLGKILRLEERMTRGLSMLFGDYEAVGLLGEGELVGRRMPNVMLPGGRAFDAIGRWGLILDRDGDKATRRLAAEFHLPFARLPRSLDELGFEGVETLYVRPDQIIALASATALSPTDLRAALALRPGAVPPTDAALEAGFPSEDSDAIRHAS